MLKKEWLLIGISVIITLLLSVGLIRWFAPQLLGVPVDLQLVKVQKEIPPFFENIFQREIIKQKQFTIPDPYTLRGKPLLPTIDLAMGPNDILGFRNRQIPNLADIITIGDSQTYGNNAPLEMNWPSKVATALSGKTNILYNMSVGGWGATQYVDIFDKALFFQPLVVVVAYYSGNDPLESFLQVYGNERWEAWRPNLSLKGTDAPNIPDKKNNEWSITFSDGFKTIFTPAFRYSSNKYADPAVRAGYDIMAKSAKEIAAKAKQYYIKIVFTIIPTKEYVYAKKIRAERINTREDYSSLVEDEQKNIKFLANQLINIPGVTYIDLASKLQNEVLQNPHLYPSSNDGHPSMGGYDFIAQIVASSIEQFLPIKPYGLVVPDQYGGKVYYVINKNKIWIFLSEEILVGNGWNPVRAEPISQRFIDNLEIAGFIKLIDPSLYGPKALY